VTLIGDSVSEAITLDPYATQVLGRGVDLELEAAACRRLVSVSCPEQDGTVPPTALALIKTLGRRLGPTVIMAVGYNDPEQGFSGEIVEVLAALHAAGVTRILWPTLIEERHPYVVMDADIRAAAAKDPSITVVDWNRYARSHHDWFQADGIHLYGYGADAMATLFHNALVKVHVAPPPVKAALKRLRAARNDHAYVAWLKPKGGYPPYVWSPVSMPRGWKIAPSGRLTGTPRTKAGSLHMAVRVTDSTGSTYIDHLTIPVRH
jgi:hypothetical protein